MTQGHSTEGDNQRYQRSALILNGNKPEFVTVGMKGLRNFYALK